MGSGEYDGEEGNISEAGVTSEGNQGSCSHETLRKTLWNMPLRDPLKNKEAGYESYFSFDIALSLLEGHPRDINFQEFPAILMNGLHLPIDREKQKMLCGRNGLQGTEASTILCVEPDVGTEKKEAFDYYFTLTLGPRVTSSDSDLY